MRVTGEGGLVRSKGDSEIMVKSMVRGNRLVYKLKLFLSEVFGFLKWINE